MDIAMIMMFDPNLKKWYLVGLTSSAAVGIVIYVLWGPNFTGSKQKGKACKKDRSPGLVNLGNSCFLSAILQACATCPSFRIWLEDQRDKPLTTLLSSKLWDLMRVLNNENDEFQSTHSPYEVLNALRAKRWLISPGEQDAHELFQILMQSLDEERTKTPEVLSLFDVESFNALDQPRPCAANRWGTDLPQLVWDQAQPFQGLLSSQLQCRRCQFKCPLKYDPFDCLSLTIPTHQLTSCSLNNLLADFIKPEVVDDVECLGCTRKSRQNIGAHGPPKRSIFTKQTTIGRFPASLCIHIQRTVWLDNATPCKKQDHISFPELLHMEPYKVGIKHMSRDNNRGGLLGGNLFTSNVLPSGAAPSRCRAPPRVPPPRHLLGTTFLRPSLASYGSGLTTTPMDRYAGSALSLRGRVKPAVYRLTAVIEHLGDVQSGHFVTYRRGPLKTCKGHLSGVWLHTSDTFVRPSKVTEVYNASAYMLFYERL